MTNATSALPPQSLFAGRIATNIRAEMAAQKRKTGELCDVIGVGHRAALRRLNGEFDFSLNEIETIAKWLNVDIFYLMADRRSAAA